MKSKTVALAVVLCLAVIAALFYLREERANTALLRAEAAQVLAEARRANDDTKQQLLQARDVREKLDSSRVEAQQQAKSLGDAVDASKQFERSQMEKGKRAQRIASALAVSQQFKVTAAEHYQSTGQWPKNNKELGLAAPESFRGDVLLSAAIEPYANTSRVRVRYVDDQSLERELHLIASVNAAGSFSWQCLSPDMQNIGEFAQGCSYRAK